jgi:hypothetical protein
MRSEIALCGRGMAPTVVWGNHVARGGERACQMADPPMTLNLMDDWCGPRQWGDTTSNENKGA